MFASEQLSSKNKQNPGKRIVFRTGMPLADGKSVLKAINHKTVVIAAGILVALVVLITLWLEMDAASTSQLDQISLPRVSLPETRRMIQETLQKVLL